MPSWMTLWSEGLRGGALVVEEDDIERAGSLSEGWRAYSGMRGLLQCVGRFQIG
jgi:hypothetical protein